MANAACDYYITVVARLPTTDLEQIFQVRVGEERLCILDLTCSHSRPPQEGKGGLICIISHSHFLTDYVYYCIGTKKEMPCLSPHRPKTYKDRLFDWPSSDFAWPSSFSDTKRFYVLNESELQCDWISLYLELAICTSHRKIIYPT
ncbi:unnamed protein product [Eruca vesicaria subsp. sativa]|uniref:Uncharacterized protein n=1 Tax=Eruca vesicaria subsp. sativa TaxID=29727 RepID=A0ABC8KFK9_ERUVS|nr:unnamed protein product [Eruca vesicaria subsp. sativa]